MESKLVGSLLSDKGEESKDGSIPHCYTKVFYELFPYFLAIGMSAEMYWEQDSTLTKYYAEAEKIRTNRLNEQLWLQGAYIYQAIGSLAPAFNSLKPTKPLPYVEKPFELGMKKQTKEDRKQFAKNKLTEWMIKVNSKRGD